MKARFHNEVDITMDNKILKGELVVPMHAKAIVLFSHGSGSSRFSKRNQMVAKYLQERNLGTLLFDLLTEQEDQHYFNRFNIDLLAGRLSGATKWLLKHPESKNCRIGYFGASTGAASALEAAAEFAEVGAVVSRGGRPDLAMNYLPQVEAPTLLIVGSLDADVLKLNQQAYDKLVCVRELVIIQGASHLFEEQGKMDEVARYASGWFERYLLTTSGEG